MKGPMFGHFRSILLFTQLQLMLIKVRILSLLEGAFGNFGGPKVNGELSTSDVFDCLKTSPI